MQRDLAALSSRSVHLIAERSGHLVHEEQPEMIVEGIRRALALVRKDEGT
jgi:pimeloyl-ACP methyl ester carboxylesterase